MKRLLTIALLLLTVTAAVNPAPASAAPTNVHMPFPCGETWYASTYSGHTPSEYSIDWNLVGNDAGRSVRAGVAGTATVMPYHSSYGNWVEVNAGNGWTYRYAHLSSITVTSGPVTPQTEIGKVGSSGNVTGPHLHYEQRLNGVVQSATFNGSAISYAYGFPGNAYTSTNCGTVSVGTPGPVDALVHGSRVKLRWGAATVATDYQIFRNGTLLATVGSPSYLDIQVSPDQAYSYAVTARNSSGSSPAVTKFVQTSFESGDMAYLMTKDGPAVCGRAGDQTSQFLVCNVWKPTGWVSAYSAPNDWGYATDRSWLTNTDGTIAYCRRVGNGDQVLCDKFDGTTWTSSMSPHYDLGYSDTFW